MSEKRFCARFWLYLLFLPTHLFIYFFLQLKRIIRTMFLCNKNIGHHACLREKKLLFRYRVYFEGNPLRFVRARAHVHALMCTRSCARAHVHALMCTRSCARAHMHALMCTRSCARAPVYALMCTHFCARAYVHVRSRDAQCKIKGGET